MAEKGVTGTGIRNSALRDVVAEQNNSSAERTTAALPSSTDRMTELNHGTKPLPPDTDIDKVWNVCCRKLVNEPSME